MLSTRSLNNSVAKTPGSLPRSKTRMATASQQSKNKLPDGCNTFVTYSFTYHQMSLLTLHPPIVLDIDISPSTEAENRLSIKAIESGKAANIDAVHAEMLKADLTTSAKIFTDLFRKIWEKDTIPEDWNKGLIDKLSTRQAASRTVTTCLASHCSHWRNHLGKIDVGTGQKLRQEQAGF